MFAVLQLNKEVEVQVFGRIETIPLTYADGMIGAIPVFETKEQAKAFAGDMYKIAELITPESKQ
jgi:hypothetical protein